jgi:hypothetical protein
MKSDHSDFTKAIEAIHKDYKHKAEKVSEKPLATLCCTTGFEATKGLISYSAISDLIKSGVLVVCSAVNSEVCNTPGLQQVKLVQLPRLTIF